MMLFWILAITDLIMVGITWAVYGSSATYRDGMLLGVHLPESAISLSPVAQLTDSYQKHIRKFYLLHLVLGVVVAIPFFWLASIGITLWCIWFCVFLARAVSLLYSAHRQLYLLKLEQGLEPARRYSNPEGHRAAGLCRPQNCRIKRESPGGCRGSLSLSWICWLL